MKLNLVLGRKRHAPTAANGSLSGPRLAVFGNCQAAATARAMRLLRPDCIVEYVSPPSLGRRARSDAEAFASFFRRFDHVFAQAVTPAVVGAEHFVALSRHHPGFLPAPNVVFAAFHPDLVYVGGPGTGVPVLVRSPVGHYNSALVLYAFLAGFTPDGAETLFSEEVFGHLGYYDYWRYSSDTLLMLGREAGLDLAEPLARWTRRGLFMHSTNHPRTFVLAEIAALLLAKAGLPPEPVEADSYIVDEFASKGMWPVYEPIARRYGVPGGYLFQTQQLGRGKHQPPRVFSLRAFIEASFALYAATPRAHLVCDRVDTWLRSDDIRRLLAERAR